MYNLCISIHNSPTVYPLLGEDSFGAIAAFLLSIPTMTFLTDDPLSEAKKVAREAFLVFEHKEGSKMVDERWENNNAVHSWVVSVVQKSS